MKICDPGRKKVLCIIGTSSSVLINFRGSLIRHLFLRGYTVYCFCSDFDEHTSGELRSRGGIPIGYKLDSKGLNPISDVMAVIELIKALKAIKPDVIFSYFVKPVIFGSIAGRMARVPRVVGMLEGLGNAFAVSASRIGIKARFVKFIQLILYRVAFSCIDTLLFLNPDDRAELKKGCGFLPKTSAILGGIGVDLDEFAYVPPTRDSVVRFLFVGRLLREKGIFEYLEAAEYLTKNYKGRVQFTVLGSFDLDNPFALKEAELRQFLSDGVVEYPGFVDNIKDWIVSSHVFVLPSYREGVPRSTQEAMAIGRPIITTDVPGCRETVIDGVNGFLIPPHSSAELIGKMEFFIHNPNALLTMGLAARSFAEEKFDERSVHRRLEGILFDEKHAGVE